MIYEGRSINMFTKWCHFVNFWNIKNPKYTLCRKFNCECKLWVLWRWCHCDGNVHAEIVS